MHTHTKYTTSTQVVLHTGMHSWLCYHTRCTKNKCHLAVEICTHAQSRQHVRIAHTRELRTQAGTAGCANTLTQTHTLSRSQHSTHTRAPAEPSTLGTALTYSHTWSRQHMHNKKDIHTPIDFFLQAYTMGITQTHTQTHTPQRIHTCNKNTHAPK